jgi:hypothetical protein
MFLLKMMKNGETPSTLGLRNCFCVGNWGDICTNKVTTGEFLGVTPESPLPSNAFLLLQWRFL